MVSALDIRRSYQRLAGIAGASFRPSSLVADVAALARAYPDVDDFSQATEATARAISLALTGRVSPTALRDDYDGWLCLHYQPRVGQGVRATMRLMYRFEDQTLLVRGFGDRRIPLDFYRRMAAVDRAGRYLGRRRVP